MNTCDHYNNVKTKAYVKGLKNVFATMCLRSLYGDQALSFPHMPWSSHSWNDGSTRNICNRYVESFKTFLGHDRKHVVRLLQLYGKNSFKVSSQSSKFESNVFSIIHLNGQNF